MIEIIATRNIEVTPASATAEVVISNGATVTINGGKGDKGDAGTAADMATVLHTMVASVPISALRAIRGTSDGEAVYCDASDVADAGTCIGVSLTAASAIGDDVSVVTSGIITDISWSLTPGGKVFIGANGLLTQTPPALAFLQVVGTAENQHSIIVNVQTAFVL